MRKNCNLDHLSLLPFYNSLAALPADRHRRIPFMDITTSTVNHQDDVIISFSGRILVSDMTELQARAIILLATRGEGESKNGKGWDLELSTCLQSQIYGSPSLSMKRSLQRFLQKRKQRSRASSPYSP